MAKDKSFTELISSTTKMMQQIGVSQSMEFLDVFSSFRNLCAGQSIVDKYTSVFTYKSPLLEYGAQLEQVLNHVATVPEPINQINEFLRKVSEEIESAENNFIYRLAIEELECENERVTELENKGIELEQRVKELETTLRVITRLQNGTKQTQPARLTLLLCITVSQIVRLHETSRELFK